MTIADLVSSDPYVIIQSMDQTYKTTVKYGTLNPIYNETFDVIVYDKETQIIDFEVYDHDLTSSHDFIGKLKL